MSRIRRSLFALALASSALGAAAPSFAQIGIRWTNTFQQWAPMNLQRQAGSPEQDLVLLDVFDPAHNRSRLLWVGAENGIVRSTSTSLHMTSFTQIVGALSFSASQAAPDLIVWTPDDGSNSSLQSFDGPGPGGPGGPFDNRPALWRITWPSSSSLPPMFFADVEADADLELVIQESPRWVRVYNRLGARLQELDLEVLLNATRNTPCQVVVFDLDGVGRDEIVVTWIDQATGDTKVAVLASTALVSAPESFEPARAQLAPLAPNPVLGSSTIAWTNPVAGRVRLALYDAAGRRVRTLTDSWMTAGTHERSWAGEDEQGRLLPPGIYLLEMDSPSGRQTRRAVLLR